MKGRLSDAALAEFTANFKVAANEAHQDFGDVGFVLGELENHRLLEELAAARKVIAAVRLFDVREATMAIREYDALFEESSGDSQEDPWHCEDCVESYVESKPTEPKR